MQQVLPLGTLAGEARQAGSRQAGGPLGGALSRLRLAWRWRGGWLDVVYAVEEALEGWADGGEDVAWAPVLEEQ